MDQRLKEGLLDSGEIDLYTTRAVMENIEGDKIANMKDFQSLMMKRRNRIKEHCDNLVTFPVNHKYLYILKSRNLIWCPVYKAASTNWCHNLLLLAGKTEKDYEEILKRHPNQPNDQAREVAPVTKFRSLLGQQDLKTLIIVRHPFYRLLSAFRDKLEQCHGVPNNCSLKQNWYYKTYGSRIVSRYRDQALDKFGDDYFTKEHNYGAPYPPARSWRDDHYPSWWEFVQFLLHSQPHLYDEHWVPASRYCSVCNSVMEYKYILKFENLREEEPYLAEALSASNVIKPRWENKNSNYKSSKEEVLATYFAQLSDKEIQGLYKIYENDFRLFGYKFHFRNITYH